MTRNRGYTAQRTRIEKNQLNNFQQYSVILIDLEAGGISCKAKHQAQRAQIGDLHWVLSLRAQGTLWKMGMKEPEGVRKPEEHGPQNQLSRAHRGSQRLKWQSQTLVSLFVLC